MNLSYEHMVATLKVDLEEKFPDEAFLIEEMERILGGLTNSLRWVVLKKARRLAGDDGILKEALTTLETSDHFSTEEMGRCDIVFHIQNTCGLDKEAASYGLQVIESTVDEAIRDGEVLYFEPIGRIRQSEKYSDGYDISLVSSLQIGPNKREEEIASVVPA